MADVTALRDAVRFAGECQGGSGPWCRHASALLDAARAFVDSQPVVPPAKACTDPCPPTWDGHWRDWHKGHGCDVEARVEAVRAAKERDRA